MYFYVHLVKNFHVAYSQLSPAFLACHVHLNIIYKVDSGNFKDIFRRDLLTSNKYKILILFIVGSSDVNVVVVVLQPLYENCMEGNISRTLVTAYFIFSMP